MSSNVQVAQATVDEAVLPERVQEALGQLVGAAREGLLALRVGVGLGVLEELMAEEVDEVVGPKGKHNPDRTAVRHGHEGGEATLGGRRVEVRRPRVRTADGESEVQLATYEQTLTVIRLGIRGKLRRTLESTNPCESMIDTVRTTQRNVKHWSSGEMGLRWTAAEMLEADKQFRKVIGYTQLPQLAIAIERRLHLPQPNQSTNQEAAIAVTV